MTTWRLRVLLSPQPHPDCVFARELTLHSDDLSEADDVVGEAAIGALCRWPGLSLRRVLSCVAEGRGDEIRPRRT